MKPTYLNIILYIFVKYLLFYLFLMIRNNDYYFINPEIRDIIDLIYYLWLFLFFPILMNVIFLIPIYFSFKLRNLVYFIIIIIVILIVEYLLYTYFASQLNLWNGVYNIIISIILFYLFFHKTIQSKFIKL